MRVNYVACFTSMISLVQTMVHPLTNSSYSVPTIPAIEMIDESSSHNFTDLSSNSSASDEYGHLTKEFLECLKIQITYSEYVILDNNTLFASKYVNHSSNGLWEYGNYYIETNKSFPDAMICSLFPIKLNIVIHQQDIILSYMTIAGMSTSLISLVLHFIAFLIVSEMRNLPGKNLASLTVSLFFAYLLFLVGKIEYDETPTCYPIGICIYYFMMVSFFWMNAISYDIFKSVRAATTRFRLMSKSAELKWFFIYSTYSWLFPAVFTGIIITGDILPFLPDELRPRFNEGYCWFRHRMSIIIFFAIPVALLMFMNIIFFIGSAIVIFSNSMRSDDHTSSLKRSLTLYLKLAIIMGLVWITGLVSGLVDNYVLSYIFVTLTTLQGLFIFIAFTRFRKTGARLQESMKTIARGPSLFSSSFNLNQSKQAVVQ